jgi:hypothetical protein
MAHAGDDSPGSTAVLPRVKLLARVLLIPTQLSLVSLARIPRAIRRTSKDKPNIRPRTMVLGRETLQEC